MWVPKSGKGTNRVMSLLPRRFSEGVARAIKADRVLAAADGYSYLHLVIVAAIIYLVVLPLWSRTVENARAAKAGIGLGAAIAVTVSWSLHKSIVWAAIHGVFSWFFVLY